MRQSAIFQLQPLEKRVFLSGTPAQSVVAEATAPLASSVIMLGAPSDVLTKAVRQELLNHLNVPNKADLQSRLDANQMGAFDARLLDYMRTRAGNTFYWNTGDVTGIRDFINTKLATSSTISNADNIVAHRFPNGNSEVYNVQLPAGDINWKTTNSNPEFVHTLNRHEFWLDLSQAYVLTGQGKYVGELISQLSSWSAQSPLSDTSIAWQPLSVATRASAWTWAYQQVMGLSGWTGEANTLFLYKLWQHGNAIRTTTPYPFNSNRSLTQARALMEIAHLVGEFDKAADWKSYGRGLLFNAMDGQLNPDGGHAESSPGYAGNVILALLEAYWLDQKKGDAAQWTIQRVQKIENAAKAHVQLLTPDGKLSPLSDTYRSTIGPFWDRARVILNNTTDFVSAKPRLRDVWLFGPDVTNGLWNSPVNPGVPARPNTYSMPQSGYYVMRSGSDANARQIIFDAGPTGGVHGHYDLLNFELFGYGKPLISDPGLYTYDNSERRTWAVSTVAHNTINVDRLNHAAVEGVDNANLWSSGLSEVAGGYQVTANHGGYKSIDNTQIWRSIWYDGDGVMVIADLASATRAHTFATTFLMPGTNMSRDLGAGWIRSNNASGNVKIQALLQPGQALHRQSQIGGTSVNIFTSSDPDTHIADDATRFYIDQNGTFAGFITLVTTFGGTTEPNITAQLVGSPNSGAFQVQIYRNGTAAELIPFFTRPGSDFRPAAPIAGANDVAWDASGRLHMVYNDRDEKNLKYSVRDASGKWSFVQTIDPGFEAGGYPSLALDSTGKPHVAYFDGDGGDLKYAKLVGGAWQTERVDVAGSVGLYTTMVMNHDTPQIGYYHRTRGDLRLAVLKSGTWKISTIESNGDVGRGASMTLNPNRVGGLAIAYDDSDTGTKKFAVETDAGWAISVVDNTMPTGGGYTSLVYEPFRDTDGQFHPTMSYYDSSNSALKFARQGGGVWSPMTVVSQGAQGLYTSLVYDSGNKPNIFFFKKTNVTAYRARKGAGWTWNLSYLGTGGREIQTARRPNGTLAYTNLDADGLRVELLAT